MNRRNTSSISSAVYRALERRNRERSRSPLRQKKQYDERSFVRLEKAAMLKVEETNLFELEDSFPEVEVRISKSKSEISFNGPAYKKKGFMMKLFQELQNSKIESPRYIILICTAMI